MAKFVRKKIRFEVIVLDNGSIGEGKRRRHLWEKLRVIANREPSGFGAACNRAVQVARGKYLVFLDDHSQVRFFVIGSDPPADVAALAGDSVRVPG